MGAEPVARVPGEGQPARVREGARQSWSPCGQGGVCVCCGLSKLCVPRVKIIARNFVCSYAPACALPARCERPQNAWVVRSARRGPGSPAPLSVPELQCVCNLRRREVETRGEGLFCLLTVLPCVCGGGHKRSACDSVLCVCLASASLNKQRLGWTLFCPVFAVELGRVRATGKAT